MKLQECFWILADPEARVPFPEVAGAARAYAPIIVARPDRMRPTVEQNEIVAWNFTDGAGKTWELDPEQVVRLFGWNPYDPHRGLGDYPSAHLAAESHHLGSKFKRNLTADNDTAPIISAKNGTPTDTQIEQIKMSIMERRMARMRGSSKALFLPGEVDVHDPKILSVDAAFIAGMLEDRHEIFMAFGVPPSLADVRASYSIGQASDWFALVFNTCIPEGNKFCAALEILIKRLSGQDIEVGLNWDEHYVMQQVRSERMKDADSLFAKGVPMNVINEYLNLGLPEYEEWDQGYLPMTLTPVSAAANEAAQEVPTPAPADFSEGTAPKPGEAGQDNKDDAKDTPAPVKEMLRALDGRARLSERAGAPGEDGRARLSERAGASGKNEKLWQAHMRLRAKSVKLIQSKVSKLFNDYRVTALRKLEHARKSVADGQVGRVNAKPGSGPSAPGQGEIQTRSLVDVLFDPTMFGHDLVNSLNPVLQATLETASAQLLEEIDRSDDPWRFAPKQVKEFIASRENKIAGAGDTAFSQLKTSLTQGVDAGETTEQLADRVRGVFNNLSKGEARRIAMTETSCAYGYARHETMMGTGVEYKCWLTSHSGNSRKAHEIAEDNYGKPEQAVPIDEPFEVDGEELMYPGDPSGSPENVINCHCIQIAVQKP